MEQSKLTSKLNKLRIIMPVLMLLSLMLLTATLIQGSMAYKIQLRQYQQQQEVSQPQFGSVYLSMPLNDFLIKLNSPNAANTKSFWGYPIISNEILSDLLHRNTGPGENDRQRITLLMVTQKGKTPAEDAWIEFDRVSRNGEIEIYDNSDLTEEKMISQLVNSGVVEKKTINLGRMDIGEGRLIPLFVSDYSGENLETKKVTSRTIYIPGTLTNSSADEKTVNQTRPVRATFEVPSHISVVYIF